MLTIARSAAGELPVGGSLLLPFQRAGAEFIAARLRALCFDEMRVGKTPQAIHACDIRGAERVLVLCPAIARANWLREFQRFSNRPGAAIEGAASPAHPTLTVCSYDSLVDVSVYNRLAKVYDAVILDESHYLSNPDSKRTVASLNIAKAARWAVALSGTPQRKSPLDLWALLWNFGIAKLSHAEFLRHFCQFRRTPRGIQVYGTRNSEELRALLRPYMVRRTLAAVAPDMPRMLLSSIAVEAGDLNIEIDMPDWRHDTEEIISVARREEADLIAALDEARDKIELLKRAQSPVLRRLLGLQKVQPAAEIIKADMEGGVNKLVVFAYHRHVLRALRALLRAYGADIIDGSTSAVARETYQQWFRERQYNRVLLCQVTAASTNIDLSIADDALFVESDWVPSTNAQALMRVVSQFKRRPVRARFLAVAGSVDERIERANVQRTRMAAEIFD